ncbi:MAG: hypothetical protein O9340_14525 [Cyclobacteriaceae bacterium]|jgi:hypothetical protein|nr:hypothetical protein [Cyclobacteriaceae bacterium]
MEDKISLQAIQKYSQQYTRKVLDRFFVDKQFISGKELLSLSEVEQINLFIIQNLFRTWKTEMQKIRSPYFDYEAEAVQEAQQQLANVLSRHIKISKNYLEPLVVQATQHTLQDVLNPYDFFSRLITGNQNKLELDRFKEDLKYLKLNKAPLLRLSQILQERKMDVVSGNEAFAILDKILEELNFSPEDIEPVLEQLSVLEPVTIDFFFEQKKPKIATSTPVQSKSTPNAHSKENKTLADEFQKIQSLKEKLTINQKFMFTKALFQGDFEKFTDTIQHIDSQQDYDAAMQFLNKQLQDWDQESEEFHEFMELIEKRFL